MSIDDDGDCVEHAFELDQVHVTSRGADRVEVCLHCGTPAYVPGQAALRDDRPPL